MQSLVRIKFLIKPTTADNKLVYQIECLSVSVVMAQGATSKQNVDVTRNLGLEKSHCSNIIIIISEEVFGDFMTTTCIFVVIS